MDSKLQLGDKAPSFTLKNTNGEDVALDSFKGKNIVLYFYPKDDTPGCTKEACSFRDNEKLFQDKNALIIGISKDGTQSHLKFINKYNLNFLLLSDEDLVASKLYGVWKEKSNFGKKYMGIERSTFIIDDQGFIKKIFRRVKVDGHTEEVLNEI